MTRMPNQSLEHNKLKSTGKYISTNAKPLREKLLYSEIEHCILMIENSLVKRLLS